MSGDSLARRLARRVRAEGPLSLAAYMAMALHDPREGYYARQNPIGAAGDFVTAPEISQIFGELIGLWCAALWQTMGRPQRIAVVELGPGRGTLASDLLRAAAIVPEFRRALNLVLVEASPVLRRVQQERLGAAQPRWVEHLDDVPAGPLLLVANEFFDALPIRQFVRAGAHWTERRVGLDAEGRLAFVDGPGDPATSLIVPEPLRTAAPAGAVVEICPSGLALAAALGRRLARDPGAALIVDYGYFPSAPGPSLRAVRRHRPVPVLTEPGTADLSAHVDFAALAKAARAAGATVWGPVPQGQFLAALGAETRLAALSARATPAQRGALESGVRRLLDPGEMGTLFKALAFASSNLPPPPGFTEEGSYNDPSAMITLGALGGKDDVRVRHAFFTREGGVSGDMFAALNCGFGSGDAPDRVARNRAIATARLGLAADRLTTAYQCHSAAVVTVTEPWRHEAAPRADGLVTRLPGIALGILTADCAPVLFADPEAGVIGAAHAGWRGALGGVLEATLARMEEQGAARDRIRAGIGPCIGPLSYEVGPEFPAPFLAEDRAARVFFAPASRAGHFLFDLAGYAAHRLRRAGVGRVACAARDTLGEEECFFSYRRAALRGERRYGRLLSAIALGD